MASSLHKLSSNLKIDQLVNLKKYDDDDELDNLYIAITPQGRLQQQKRNLKQVCLELPLK